MVESDPSCNVTGFMVGVATGSRDENQGMHGVSHLLEHTVFRHTGTRDAYQMAKEIEGVGGALNAFTHKEMTAFHAIAPNESVSVAMDIIGDLVAGPRIGEEDTEMEKEIVLQELNTIENSPKVRICKLFEAHLWRGHRLEQDVGGDKTSVSKLTSEDLRAYYEEKYRIPNLSVYAVGDVDIDSVVSWAESVLDCRAGGRRNVRIAPSMPKADYRFVESGTDCLQVAMGFPFFDGRDEDKVAVGMLSSILGNGMCSRLFHSVREQKALVYSIGTAFSAYSDAGSLTAYMSCTENNVEEAMHASAEVFGKLRSEGLEKGELDRVKNLCRRRLTDSMESVGSRLSSMCLNNLINSSTLTLEDNLSAIDAVTEDDVMRMAEEVLRPERLNVLVLGKAGAAVSNHDISDFGF